MTNHKFNTDGNRVRTASTSNGTDIRANDPRTVPTPKPVPAPPKQK